MSESIVSLSGFDLYLLIGPIDNDDLRLTVPPKRQEGPPQSSIDIKLVLAGAMLACDAAVASGWKPECRDAGNLPLAAVAVAAKDQVDLMVRFHLIQDVGSMS